MLYISEGSESLEHTRKFAIKRPFGNYAVIPYGILIMGLVVMMLIRVNFSNSQFSVVLLSFALAVHMTWFMIIVIQFIRFKPRHLQLMDNSIAIYNIEVNSADIEKIIVQGYFKPTIGIMPKGKRFVPASHCFAFREHDASMKVLNEWANQNQVEVKTGRYRTWI